MATNAVIAATDSLLVAFGKLQAQITALSNSLANYVTLATEQTIEALKKFEAGITLIPQATPTYERGRVYFDDTNDCLAFMDSISGRSVQVGYEVLMLARNNTGVQINNGQVVYINGSTGTNSTIALARADAEATSLIIGIATHNIANNTVGKVVVFGLANDLDTSAFTDGQEVFLSAATAGALTATPPASPNFVVRIGIVERAHVTQGKILVQPDKALANNNSLGASQRVAATQNAAKTYVDAQINLKTGVTAFITTGDAITTSNTLSNIAGMAVSLEANTRYRVYGMMRIGCNNTGGVRLAATFPALATTDLAVFGYTTGLTAFIYARISASGVSVGAWNTVNASNGFVYILGEVATGANAGDIQFQFASGTNTQTSTIFQLGTWLNFTKL